MFAFQCRLDDMSSQEANLFDAAPNAEDARRGQKRTGEAPTERRIKLKSFDAAAAQLLNPYGASIVKGIDVKAVWEAVSQGSKAAKFHSDLAADDSYRVGIGLSRVAESLLAAIAQLKDPINDRFIIAEVLKAARTEADKIEPFLKALYAGKGSQGSEPETIGFGRPRAMAARNRGLDRQPSPEEVCTAAREFYGWLGTSKSPLRGLIAGMSGYGCFFAAQVNDKVARAWKEHKPATQQAAEDAAYARRTATMAPGGSSSSTGDRESYSFFAEQ